MYGRIALWFSIALGMFGTIGGMVAKVLRNKPKNKMSGTWVNRDYNGMCGFKAGKLEITETHDQLICVIYKNDNDTIPEETYTGAIDKK
jgi:hypothetical protein